MTEKQPNKILEFIKGIIIFLIYFYVPSLIIGIFKNILPIDTTTSQTIFLICFQLIFTTIFILIFKKNLIADLKDMKQNHRQHLNIAIKYWIYGFICMILFNYILNMIINPGGLATNEEVNRQALGATPIYSVLAMVIFAPIVEELVFRAGFKKAFSKAIPFAIFCGLVFGLMHVSTAYESFNEILPNWKQLLYVFPYGALGYAFGLIYFKTKNIFSTIIVHAIHNGLTVILILIASLLGRFL